MTFETYLETRKPLRNIKRFGSEYTITRQNLCEHGYHVANIFMMLARHLSIRVTEKDIELVLNHDVAESATGDLNSLTKYKSLKTQRAWLTIENESVPKGLKEYIESNLERSLGPIGTDLFKLSDWLDALMYCLEEREMGNNTLGVAISHYMTKIEKMCYKLDCTFFYEKLLDHYELRG